MQIQGPDFLNLQSWSDVLLEHDFWMENCAHAMSSVMGWWCQKGCRRLDMVRICKIAKEHVAACWDHARFTGGVHSSLTYINRPCVCVLNQYSRLATSHSATICTHVARCTMLQWEMQYNTSQQVQIGQVCKDVVRDAFGFRNFKGLSRHLLPHRVIFVRQGTPSCPTRPDCAFTSMRSDWIPPVWREQQRHALLRTLLILFPVFQRCWSPCSTWAVRTCDWSVSASF